MNMASGGSFNFDVGQINVQGPNNKFRALRCGLVWWAVLGQRGINFLPLLTEKVICECCTNNTDIELRRCTDSRYVIGISYSTLRIYSTV